MPKSRENYSAHDSDDETGCVRAQGCRLHVLEETRSNERVQTAILCPEIGEEVGNAVFAAGSRLETSV